MDPLEGPSHSLGLWELIALNFPKKSLSTSWESSNTGGRPTIPNSDDGMRAIGMIVVETKILHLIQITCPRWLNSINLFPVSTIHPGLRSVFKFQFIFFGSKNFKQDSVGFSHRGAKRGVRTVRELQDLTCRWYFFSSNSFACRFFNMLNFLSHKVFTNTIYF